MPYYWDSNDIRPGEVFVGNTNKPDRPDLANVEGFRLGDVALDIHGIVIPKCYGYRPIYVGKGRGEAQYDRVMTERLERTSRGGRS